MIDILLLGSKSVDPHSLADQDPGSQNIADPTDSDPKRRLQFNEPEPVHEPGAGNLE